MATSPIDMSAAIPARIIELIQLGPAPGTAVMRNCQGGTTPHQEAWRLLIDATVDSWDHDSSALEDDGIDPPSHLAIAGARKLALYFLDAGLPAATRIVPTGDGGVAVEFESNSDFISFETDRDGKIEFFHFQRDRLVSRFFPRIPYPGKTPA